MRLFLASAELSHPSNDGRLTDALAELAGPVSRISVVANGRDEEAPERRHQRVATEMRSLEPLHAGTTELDLRDYADRPHDLAEALADTDLLWVTGGDMNLLRLLVVGSGLDTAIRQRLDEDTIVYSGYSAGACLAGPALMTGDVEHDAQAGGDIGWGGLGLVKVTIVPHLPLPGEPDNDFVHIVEHLRGRGLSVQPLRDGQAVVVAAGLTRLI